MFFTTSKKLQNVFFAFSLIITISSANLIHAADLVPENEKPNSTSTQNSDGCIQSLFSTSNAASASYEDLKKQYHQDELANRNKPEKATQPEQLNYWTLSAKSRELSHFFYWHTASDQGVFYDSIISAMRQKASEKKGQHISDVYGIETMRDLKRMYRYLDQIPIGPNFKLTPEIIKTAHAKGNKTQKTFQQSLTKGPFSILAGYLFKPGHFKKRRNQLSLGQGVTEEQYKTITNKLNELLNLGVFSHVNSSNRHLYELKPSRMKPPKFAGGKYIGWFLYPSGNIVDQAIEDITNWVNVEMERWRKQLPGAFDPIYISVVAKQALLYLHPFVDGNGRVSFAVRDKILEVFNLLPESRIDLFHDIDLTIKQDYNLTKLGIARRLRQLEDTMSDPPKSAGTHYGLPIYKDGAFFVDGKKVNVSRETAPDTPTSEIYLIGNIREKEFIFTSSGFFQDYTGVNYTIAPGSLEAGTPRLVPLADANLVLYAFGEKQTKVDDKPFRDLNKYRNQLFSQNLKFARALMDNKSLGQRTTIAPYEDIQNANENGQPHFYSWEKEMVIHSVQIKDNPVTDPLAVLAPFNNEVSRQDGTLFDTSLNQNSNMVSWDNIIGQAQRLDIYFAKLAHEIRRKHPRWSREITPLIMKSRKKIHTATRVLLKKMFPLLVSLFESNFDQQTLIKDRQSWNFLRQQRLLIGLYQYTKNTHFWYENFEAGIRKFNSNRVTLLRISSVSRMVNTGLVPEAWLGKTIEQKVPYIKKAATEIYEEMTRSKKNNVPFDKNNLSGPITKWLATKILENDTYKTLLDNIITQVLVNPYRRRGLEIEFEREFYLLSLHWANSPPKQGVSLSTKPGLVFSEYPNFESPINDSAFFVVSVPIDSVRVAFASTYSSEYEITVMDPVLNLFNLRRNFILYQSQQSGPVKEITIISEKEAKEKNIKFGDLNYVISDNEKPDEAERLLRRLYYFPNGEPENIDSLPWRNDYTSTGSKKYSEGEGYFDEGEGFFDEGEGFFNESEDFINPIQNTINSKGSSEGEGFFNFSSEESKGN